MNLKSIPFFVLVSLSPLKFFLLLQASDITEMILWGLISLGFGWIEWAYWKNREMPARAGNFKYQNGKNDFIRALYAAAILCAYLLCFLAIRL